MNWPVGSLFFSFIGLINTYYGAGNIRSHSFLELKTFEANIPFLVIVEVLGGKLFALYQYCRYTTWYMIMNYDNDIG